MSEKINFENYIKLTERFYAKPCDAAEDRFDLYELKKSESKRHPEGKMDDVVFGLPFENVALMVSQIESGRVAKDIEGFVVEMRKISEEIKKNVTEFIS